MAKCIAKNQRGEFAGSGRLMTGYFFSHDTATSKIYTLSLHDALPISGDAAGALRAAREARPAEDRAGLDLSDRKSTRLNSSHVEISYADFCSKKKKAASRDQQSRSQASSRETAARCGAPLQRLTCICS